MSEIKTTAETIEAGKKQIIDAAKCGCGFCAICNPTDTARAEADKFLAATLAGYEDSMLAVDAQAEQSPTAEALKYLYDLQTRHIAELQQYAAGLEAEIDFLRRPLVPTGKQWKWTN
jgi:hypothetical protein